MSVFDEVKAHLVLGLVCLGMEPDQLVELLPGLELDQLLVEMQLLELLLDPEHDPLLVEMQPWELFKEMELFQLKVEMEHV